MFEKNQMDPQVKQQESEMGSRADQRILHGSIESTSISISMSEYRLALYFSKSQLYLSLFKGAKILIPKMPL